MNWIVCPVRAGLEMTVAAVESFLNQDLGDVRVLLYMNSDDDGLLYNLGDRYGENLYVAMIPSSGNESVSRCWNSTLGMLFDDGETYALVCNNDIELRKEAYRLLISDGGDFVTGIGDADRERVFSGESDPSRRRPHPDFSCYFIRKGAWEKTGPFDEQFTPAYCEDCDYHIRMHQAGVEAYSIAVPFYHRVSGTMKHLTEDEQRRIHEAAHLNRQRFQAKWGCQPGDARYYQYFQEPAACSR